jgi:proline iminopeptidase
MNTKVHRILPDIGAHLCWHLTLAGRPLKMISSTKDLYPALEAYKTHSLQVCSTHNIYFEESGNPQGIPVIFVHGGPGGGTNPDHRRFFNPKKYRIILFDQRGCGKSLPFAELKENTTWDLVGDMEKIRLYLGINTWVLFGGSWGSTLALTYAIAHPKSVSSMVLRGIFLLRKKEIDWFYQEGCSKIFPDLWEAYLAPIPEDERRDMLSAYHKRLTGSDQKERARAAHAWSVWEGSTSKLLFDPKMLSAFGEDKFADAFARIECHYFMNKGFFPEDNYLINNIGKIRHIPALIVQGRYDVVCPMDSAWALHRAWPEAQLVIVPDAGHSAMEMGIKAQLVEATDRIVF